MTYLDKARKKYPHLDPETIVREMCPQDLFLEKESKCNALDANNDAAILRACKRCWERECQE